MTCKYCKTNLYSDTLEVALLKLFNCNTCFSSIKKKAGFGYLVFLSLQTRFSSEDFSEALSFAGEVVGTQPVI